MNVATGNMDEEDKQQDQWSAAVDLLVALDDSPAKATVERRRLANIYRIADTIDHFSFRASDYVGRQQAVRQVAKADPNNIQEVAASQLAIINSYYQSGLQQSQRSFFWSLVWGGVGLAFLIAAVIILLFRQPTEVAWSSGIAAAFMEVFAGTYLYLYKHASDQLAAFRVSLESTQRLLLANSMCEKLEGDVEQQTRAELIRLMVNSAVQLTIVGKSKHDDQK